MRALKNPVGDVFVGTWPEEAQPNSVQGLVDTHVTSGQRSMVSREDITRQRNNDEDQEFLIVLNRFINMLRAAMNNISPFHGH